MRYDYMITGAGFSGAVLAERIASQLNKKVLLIDKRAHIGGNCYDYYDDHGILVHKYGPHIFHTNSAKVWRYLHKFTEWTEYYHKVLAVVDGMKIPVPFNLNSLYMVFSPKYAAIMEEALIEKFGFGMKIPILKLMESKDKSLKFLADYIYQNIFLGYTAKQWDLKPEELDKSVTSRIPVYISRDDRYFQDKYQGIPEQGYTEMFENIINHPNITLQLNTDFKQAEKEEKFDKLIFTGPIDEFFNDVHGKLPYRSLKFKLKTYDREYYQETSQVNYPNNYDFTRITEFKHFIKEENPLTTIALEYSMEYERGVNDPYYPVPKEENDEIYRKYKAEAEKISNTALFAGRLAEYKYYNMDQIAAAALTLFEKKIANGK